MINLVKNELIKIFHKKGLYIYGILIIVFMGIELLSSNNYDYNYFNETYYENLQDSLSRYDLENSEDLEMYVYDKAQVDKYKYLKEYDRYSPEFYYIDNEIFDTLMMLNRAEYIEKDDELYNLYNLELENKLDNVKNFDWKAELLKEKENLEKEKRELESREQASFSRDRIKNIEYNLEAIDFRLRNNIPKTKKAESLEIENYISSAMHYEGYNKDEDSYEYRSELLNKRSAEKDYYISKYKLDNNIVATSGENFQECFISLFEGLDMFFIIAILIVAGGIFAEEFNKGTIKQLLIKPFTRTKIFFSKLIAIGVAFLAFMLFYGVVMFVASLIECGNMTSLFNPVLEYSFTARAVVEYNIFIYIAIKMLAILPELIILTLLCVFVGVLFTNTVGAIISVFGVIFVNGLVAAFMDSKTLSLIPMNCWDFTEFLFGGISYNPHSTLLKSVIVCVITIAVLLGTSVFIFKKKDIKNQ